MNRLKLLSDLSDKELFEVICRIGEECKYRIIELLQNHNITSYSFTKPIGDCPFLTVFDNDNGRQDIIVIGIGYTVELNNAINLYVIDVNNKIWRGDDACVSEELWDVYKELKSNIKC